MNKPVQVRSRAPRPRCHVTNDCPAYFPRLLLPPGSSTGYCLHPQAPCKVSTALLPLAPKRPRRPITSSPGPPRQHRQRHVLRAPASGVRVVLPLPGDLFPGPAWHERVARQFAGERCWAGLLVGRRCRAYFLSQGLPGRGGRGLCRRVWTSCPPCACGRDVKRAQQGPACPIPAFCQSYRG